MTWTAQVAHAAGAGWNWRLWESNTASMLQHEGWALTRRGAIWQMRQLRRRLDRRTDWAEVHLR